MEEPIQWDALAQAKRPKRAQVARACAWCRINRLRCDNAQPCRNCQNRKQACRRDKTEPLTLPRALKKIEELEAQISSLEAQAQARNAPFGRGDGDERMSHDHEDVGMSLRARGILTKALAESSTQFYGLSSLQNFVSRLRIHLHLAHGWIYSDEDLQPRAVTLPFAASAESMSSPGSVELNDGVYMHKEQELECLRLFWQSYHCAIPILDEREFQDHHASLWAKSLSTTTRADSAIVDIILAICIQFGMTRVQPVYSSPGVEDDSGTTDPSNAGRWYFQRSQSLLKAELERPSIRQLQCQILAAVYLRDASFFNMALGALAGAAQTAYALGLHLEAAESSLRDERELHKRLWCMVHVLESKMNMDHGRPFLTPQLDVHLPQHDHQLASASTEMFIPSSKLKITWLTYHHYHVRLVRLARHAYEQFNDHRADFISTNEGKDFHHTEHALTEFDDMLTKNLAPLQSWLESVPGDLQCNLTSTSEVPGLDRYHVEWDQRSPVWLQRQQVMLRLLYHDININLCRNFILFPSPTAPTLTVSTRNSLQCLVHSVALTDIIYQVLQQTDVLHGWHRAYQFQWDAAISLVGFAFSDLTSPFTSIILADIEKAIAVLDGFGRSVAVARSAGQIIRNLHARLLVILRNGLNTPEDPTLSF